MVAVKESETDKLFAEIFPLEVIFVASIVVEFKLSVVILLWNKAFPLVISKEFVPFIPSINSLLEL